MKFVETKYVFIGKTSQVLWMCVNFWCLTSLSNHLVYSGCHQPPKPAPSRGSNPWPKQTSHWLDWLRSNQIQKSYVTGFRVCTYTMHARIHNSQAQAEAHTHTFKHTHLVTQTHTHTHVQSCKNPPTLTPTCARSLSVWVHCGKSAFWRRILHHGISQLCPAPLAKPSYRGYGSGKLKQPSQGFRVLWKFKSQVQVVNELWEGERWGRWTRCCHICRRYNCKAKRGGKQTDGFWEWRLVFFFLVGTDNIHCTGQGPWEGNSNSSTRRSMTLTSPVTEANAAFHITLSDLALEKLQWHIISTF